MRIDLTKEQFMLITLATLGGVIAGALMLDVSVLKAVGIFLMAHGYGLATHGAYEFVMRHRP